MPNMVEHILIGVGAALLGYTAYKYIKKEKIELGDILASGLAGAVASGLPDILEPANSPRHRKTLHSSAILLTVSILAKKIDSITTLEEKQKLLIQSALLGYISHLASDATTPASIPIV